jgi:hypothetical protein
MKAHWLNGDECVLVTGTLDPMEALAHIEAKAAKIAPGEGREFDARDMFFRALDVPGRAERGNIVPQHPEAEYRWVWMAADNGRCKAVVFE